MYQIKSEWASRPPMGWNSWDCFGVNVTEAEVKANADFMAKNLKQYGWEYIVVDLGWYAPNASKDNYKEPNINMRIDEYGRLLPALNLHPSAADGQGFKPLADYIHSLGLKFGIHIMRGVPWIAAKQKTPIKGSTQTAYDIAVPEDKCQWYNSMHGVDCALEGGQAYYDSLVELYASWDVDFIKADDMNSWDGEGYQEPYHVDEIQALSMAIGKQSRPMVLSLSPGAALRSNINHLRQHAHMWRISCDFWDDWNALKKQFDRCVAWAPYVKPGHWPDADMLPFGKIGIRGEVGDERQTYFTHVELKTLMSLWAIFRSPLMYGGHLPESDEFAISLISNKELIHLNQYSHNNKNVYHDGKISIWKADDTKFDRSYLAMFNLTDSDRNISYELSSTGFIVDVWTGESLTKEMISNGVAVNAHGCLLIMFV